MNKIKNSSSWWGFTWNPITGCTKLSEGCKHCFAYTWHQRFMKGDFSLRFHPERLKELDKLKKLSKVFLGSMTDMFHPAVDPVWFYKVLETTMQYPQHTFLTLTKRPENIIGHLYNYIVRKLYDMKGTTPLSKLWIGASIENQAVVVPRCKELIASSNSFPFFLSVEPMLGPVDIGSFLATGKIKWVICGPETGAGKRACNAYWPKALYEQCQEYRVPFFYKGTTPRLPREFPKELQ